MLEAILKRVHDVDMAELTAEWFSKRYNVMSVERTAKAILYWSNTIPRPREQLEKWKAKYNFKPDADAYHAVIIRALSDQRIDAETLVQTRQLIQKVSSMGSDFEKSPQLKQPRNGLLYARYLFIEGIPNKAMAVLQPFLQRRNTKDVNKAMATTMIFAFLPQEHPLRVAVFDSLRDRGAKRLLDQCLKDANNFSAVFARWVQEDELRYGGGSVFDATHTTPVNQQAADAVFFPKKET